MSNEVQDRAFDPFYTMKSSGKGTGLRLSQVYRFVQQLKEKCSWRAISGMESEYSSDLLLLRRFEHDK